MMGWQCPLTNTYEISQEAFTKRLHMFFTQKWNNKIEKEEDLSWISTMKSYQYWHYLYIPYLYGCSKKSANTLGNESHLNRPSIEMITICEPLIKKKNDSKASKTTSAAVRKEKMNADKSDSNCSILSRKSRNY